MLIIFFSVHKAQKTSVFLFNSIDSNGVCVCVCACVIEKSPAWERESLTQLVLFHLRYIMLKESLHVDAQWGTRAAIKNREETKTTLIWPLKLEEHIHNKEFSLQVIGVWSECCTQMHRSMWAGVCMENLFTSMHWNKADVTFDLHWRPFTGLKRKKHRRVVL